MVILYLQILQIVFIIYSLSKLDVFELNMILLSFVRSSEADNG